MLFIKQESQYPHLKKIDTEKYMHKNFSNFYKNKKQDFSEKSVCLRETNLSLNKKSQNGLSNSWSHFKFAHKSTSGLSRIHRMIKVSWSKIMT